MTLSVHAGNQTARELHTYDVATFLDIVNYSSSTLHAPHISQATRRHVMVSVHAGNQTAKELQAFAVATFLDNVSYISYTLHPSSITSHSQTHHGIYACRQPDSQRAAGLCSGHFPRHCQPHQRQYCRLHTYHQFLCMQATRQPKSFRPLQLPPSQTSSAASVAAPSTRSLAAP